MSDPCMGTKNNETQQNVTKCNNIKRNKMKRNQTFSSFIFPYIPKRFLFRFYTKTKVSRGYPIGVSYLIIFNV